MEKVVLAVEQALTTKKFEGEKSRVSIDGFRINFSNAWLLIRPSGTEPKIRIMSDSSNDDYAKDLLRQGNEFVSEIVKKFQ